MKADEVVKKIQYYDSLFGYREPEQEKPAEAKMAFSPHHLSTERLGQTLRAFSAISQNFDLILRDESVKFLQSLKPEILSFESICRENSGLGIVQKKERLDLMRNLEMFYRRFSFKESLQGLQAAVSGLESSISREKQGIEDKLGTLAVSTGNALREVEALSLQYSLEGSASAVVGGLDRVLRSYEAFDPGSFEHLREPAKAAAQSVLKAKEGIEKNTQETLGTLYVNLNRVMATLNLDSQFKLAGKESNLYNLAKEAAENADISSLSAAKIYVGQDFRAVFCMIARNHRQRVVFSIKDEGSAYSMHAYVKEGNCPNNPFRARVVEGVLEQYGGSLKLHSGDSFANYEITLPKKPGNIFPESIKNYAGEGAQAENMPKQ